MEKMYLKIKKSLALEVVQIIILIYAIFLFFLGIIIKNTELVIEVIIMISVVIIFNYLNKDTLIVKQEGIEIKKCYNIKYKEIEKVNMKRYMLEIRLKNSNKIKKIYFSKSENNIDKFIKYIMSKI